jgi:hypothetical protein
MPKSLQEIKNFNTGVIFNASERDTSADTPAYSLNIEANTEEGILDSIRNNRFVFNLSRTTTLLNGGIYNYSSFPLIGYNRNKSSFVIKDIEALQGDNSVSFSALGIDGISENLVASSVEPILNFRTAFGDSKTYPSEGEVWSKAVVKKIDSSGITADQTEFPYASTSETHTISAGLGALLIIDGFSDGDLTITVKNATVATDLDTKEFTLKTSNGEEITYRFDDSGSPVTGADAGSGKCCIQISGTDNAVIGEEIRKAITRDKQADNSTASLGHGSLIKSVTTTGDASSDYVMTFRQTISSENDMLSEGSYWSLGTEASAVSDANNPYGSFSGRQTSEIIRTLSVDTVNKKLTVERGCFGTKAAAYTANTKYAIFTSDYLINGEYVRSTHATLIPVGWDDYGANHIGGSYPYIIGGGKESSTTSRRAVGKCQIGLSNEPSSIVFDAVNKTMTGLDITSTVHSENDEITIRHSNSLNNGLSFIILKHNGATLTLSESVTNTRAMASETLTSGDFYYEVGLIKNPTFAHQINETSHNVGASQIYKFNNWKSRNKYWIDNTEGGVWTTNNGFIDSTDNIITKETSGVTKQPESVLSKGVDSSLLYYPYTSDSNCAKIIARYKETARGVVLDASDNIINASNTPISSIDFDYQFEKDDVIIIGDINGTYEYAKIVRVEESQIEVERGVWGTTAATYTAGNPGTRIYTNIKPSLCQNVDKRNLKKGQTYTLSFFAKSTNGGDGGLSIEFNGGYINKSMKWVKYGTENNRGYTSSSIILGNETRNDRWIDFNDLEQSYNDRVDLDNVFRRYEITFYLEKDTEFNTDLEIEFTSKGKTETDVFIDLISLQEHQQLSIESLNFRIHSSSFINRQNFQDLVMYDSIEKKLKVSKEFTEDSTSLNEATIESSPYTNNLITSTFNTVAYNSNNREVHMGFGSKEEDTNPLWLGYLNSVVFGEDSTNQLYLDEDTVHIYNESGGFSFSKMCLAGEFEYISAEYTAADTLTVTMTNIGVRVNKGDNIIIREWQDVENNWEGAGVWYISAEPATDSFVCKKVNGSMGNVATKYKGAAWNKPVNPRNGKICFRPYYYYGIREGDNVVYRINPDDLINFNGGTNSEYSKGKTQRSFNVGMNLASIATCHNHASDGSQGGYIYLLQSNPDSTSTLDIKVADVCVAYNKWDKESLITTDLAVDMKPYHWATFDNKDGDLRNSQPMGYGSGVVKKKASSRCPNIDFSGIPSDILETKGTKNTYVLGATDSSTNTPAMFDTRLWIQFRPQEGGTFGEGARFLFCARTDVDTTITTMRIGAGDRTPPTTLVNTTYRALNGTSTDDDSNRHMFPASFNSENPHYVFKCENSFRSDDHGTPHSILKMWLLYEDGETVDTNSLQHWHRFKGKVALCGENVGWVCPDDNFTEGVSIDVAKYGLCPLGDNDGDGVIDGTGLVTANTTSLTSDLSNTSGKYGHYGHEGVRVSSHAVGVLGSGNGGKWLRQSGGWMTGYGSDDDTDGNQVALEGREAEELIINQCLFISSDTHWGDIRQGFSDGVLSKDNMQGGDLVGTKIWGGNGYIGTRPQFFSSSDDLDSSTSDAPAGAHGDGYKNQFNYVIAGACTGYGNLAGTANDADTNSYNDAGDTSVGGSHDANLAVDSDTASDNYWSWSSSKYSGKVYSNPAKHPHYYWDKSNPMNSEIYTKIEIEAEKAITNPGSYCRSFWTAPSSLHRQHYEGYDERGSTSSSVAVAADDDDGFEFYPNVIMGGFNLPKTYRVDRLNYRAGVMIKPLSDDYELDLRESSIESPVYPDCIYHVGNKTTAIPVNNGVCTANGGPVTVTTGEQTIDVANNATPSAKCWTLQENADNSGVVGKNIYKGGVLVGKCVDAVYNLGSGSYGQLRLDRIEVQVNDNDVLTMSANHSPANIENHISSKIFITTPLTNADGESLKKSNLFVFNIKNELPSYSFINPADYRYDGTYNNYGGYSFNEDESYLFGKMSANSSYDNSGSAIASGGAGGLNDPVYLSGDGNCSQHYPLLKIAQADVKGPTNGAVYFGFKRSGHRYKSTDMFVSDVSKNSTTYNTTIDTVLAFGSQSRLVGNMISIIDADTGYIQTRYIVGSQYQHSNLQLCLNLHYPLGHTPTTNDKFFIWSHKMACTSELKLDIQEVLTWDFAGDGTNTTIFDNSLPVSKNPQEVQIDNPNILVTFGGADLEKVKKGLIKEVTDDVDNIELTFNTAGYNSETNGKRPFNVGDMITFTGDGTDNSGTYAVTVAANDSIKVVNASGATNSVDYQHITTNQYEIVLADKGGDGVMGEVRLIDNNINASKAGIDSIYDTGASVGNLLRTAGGDDMFLTGETQPAVDIAVGPTVGDNDFFLKNTTYKYKISLEYDGYQEGPLSWNYWSYTDSATRSYLNITIRVKKYSKRLTSVNLYRKDSEEAFYRKVANIKTNRGWKYLSDSGSWSTTVRDTGDVFGTYESETGINETVSNITVKYALSAEIDGYLFVGDCSHEDIKDASNQLFRSKPGKKSIFDWTNDFVILKSTPTAMTNFNNRLYVFDESNIYRINQHSKAIEDTYEGIGCLSQDSLVVTEYGMFFADKNGVYMHNGTAPSQISLAITRGGSTDLTWASKTSILDVSWEGLLSVGTLKDIKMTFDSSTNSILVIISSTVHDSNKDKSEDRSYIWAYNIAKSRWDLWELDKGKSVGKPFIGKKGSVFIPVNDSLWELKKGSDKKYLSWLSKKINMSQDSIMKVYNKLKVNGISEDLNLGGDKILSGDRLLIQTSEGTVPSASITHLQKNKDSEYKLKGSNKKGRWVQFLIENVKKPIDSFGIIFRRKTTK